MSESVPFKFVCSSVAFALIGTLLFSVPSADPAAAARTSAVAVSGPARVIDGDTIDIDGVRIRLEGIDAPEAAQSCAGRGGGSWSCGTAATNALDKMIGRHTVDCAPRGTDKYGRMLGVCHAGPLELNAEMVRQGLAWAFVKYSASYVEVEAEARKAGVGVWQGAADPPWVYRERQWTVAATEAPEGCAIKGNVSNKGNIYHTPWSPWYKRVKVDLVRGERWFCTEEEALEAGWRPAMTH